jgi:predicted house-cleaning noncanonical NTP pyrophosphatase (MazG superfamily)
MEVIMAVVSNNLFQKKISEKIVPFSKSEENNYANVLKEVFPETIVKNSKFSEKQFFEVLNIDEKKYGDFQKFCITVLVVSIIALAIIFCAAVILIPFLKSFSQKII